MLEGVVPAFLVSSLLGLLSGLGIGGGSLLMLWLTTVLGWTSQEARRLNLLFFLPGAALATFLRRKSIPLKKLWPVILSGCAAAAGGAFLQNHISQGLIRKAFGVLLRYAGCRELFYKQK
mgnify:FL=1